VCSFLFFLVIATNQYSRGNLSSFNNYLDGNLKAHPFSNCFTLTNDDFTNLQHHNKDHIAVAFELWWTSAQSIYFQVIQIPTKLIVVNFYGVNMKLISTFRPISGV